MMKTLLYSLLLAFPIFLSAQRTLPATSQEHLIPARTAVGFQKSVRDTLVPGIITDPCFRTIVPYFTPDTGYILGSNIYGDVLQLQRIVNPTSTRFNVESVEAFMTLPDSNAFDIYVTAVILDEPGSDGRPSTILGISDSIRVGDFNRDTTGGFIRTTTFIFSDTVTLTNDSFLIGFNFINAYRESPLRFIGVYGSGVGCGDGKNVIQGSANADGGLDFGSVFQYYNANLEIPMYVAIDNLPTTSTKINKADYSTVVAPNPVGERIRITFSANLAGNYTARLVDLGGRQLRQFTNTSRGNQQIDWDASSLPAGVYLYHIDGPAGRQSGKLVKQ